MEVGLERVSVTLEELRPGHHVIGVLLGRREEGVGKAPAKLTKLDRSPGSKCTSDEVQISRSRSRSQAYLESPPGAHPHVDLVLQQPRVVVGGQVVHVDQRALAEGAGAVLRRPRPLAQST